MTDTQSSLEIDREIEQLQNKRALVKAKEFKNASKNWFTLRQQHFDSASHQTEEYLTFHKLFKTQFTKLLKEEFDIDKIKISTPNHFDVTLFFSLKNGNTYYVSLSDLRWMTTFLIRTATDFNDYTGGNNQYCNLDDYDRFLKDLKSIVQ